MWFGVVCDILLAGFIVPRFGLLKNTENFRYETIDWAWTWIVSVGPWLPIVVLFPIIILSKSVLERWVSIVLILFPASVVIAEWIQLAIVDFNG